MVLVTFCARDGDPYARMASTGEFIDADHHNRLRWGPALRLLADDKSSLYGRVSDLYYFCHPAKAVDPRRVLGRTHGEVAIDTRAALERHLPPPIRPTFHTCDIETTKSPIDHDDLFQFVRTRLRAIRREHPKAELVLQVSSGTDAMRNVLLLAGLVGLVAPPIRLIQAERNEGAMARPDSPFSEIQLQLASILHVAAATVVRPEGDYAATVNYDEAKSPALRAAIAQAMQAAALPFPLLLRGERGVGKSSIVGLIRGASGFRRPERDRSWPSIACGQYPDAERMHLELCGAARGAYTDLKVEREGLIELANQDTLFLDEIHDLGADSQRALIRVLEDGSYRRLGESKIRHSKFRLIAGTNLSRADLKRRLHPDFFDRIAMLEVEIPPLRECREDLPWMWRATCEEVATRSEIAFESLAEHSSQVLRSLRAHSLPGNWRDLKKVAVRAAAHVKSSGRVEPAALEQILAGLDDGGHDSDTARANGGTEPILRNRAKQKRHGDLERALGKDFELLWNAHRDGEQSKYALERLLDDRDKARRAFEFVKEVYPQRSASLRWT